MPRLPKFWSRRSTPPAEIVEALELSRNDRVLAWSMLVGGGAVVALVDGLRIITPRGQKLIRGWWEVDHASWEQNSAMLLVWWVDSSTPTPLEIVDDEGSVPEAVRERVQSSVLLTMAVPLPGRSAGKVALRRDGAGQVSAQVLLPQGVRGEDPEVAAAVESATRRLWAEAGDDLRPQFAADTTPPTI